MSLELRIWGPAFGLPSIDPECLATVTYLNRILDRDQWVVVAAYDPSQSPTGDFPLLRDGTTCIGGFRAIVHYLHNHHRYGLWLDTGLDSRQRADGLAISTFIAARAQPLLDFSLYVSHENYAGSTRPAFTHILPQTANYFIPSSRHAAAKTRTKSLGLTATDVDGTQEQQSASTNTVEQEFVSASPSLLFRQKQTLGSVLRQLHAETQFRLDTLVSSLLDPIQGSLGDKAYLLDSNEPSSLDCLAFGYLALMQYPSLPNTWLSDTLRTKYSKVHSYVSRLRHKLLGSANFTAGEALTMRLSHTSNSLNLPWRVPTPPTWQSTASTLFTSSLDLILPAQHRSTITGRARIQTSEDAKAPWTFAQLVVPTTLTLTASMIALLSYLAFGHSRDPVGGSHHFRGPAKPATLKGLGEAGAMLGALGTAYGGRNTYGRETELGKGMGGDVLHGKGARVDGVDVGAVEVGIDNDG